MPHLVSIIIPAFNAENYIEETICSALAQTWTNKEVIVVDDGSTDSTLAIAKRFSYKAVKVLTQRNRGATAARNLGFTNSRGEYIQWLDADDVLAPDKVEQQMRHIESYNDDGTIFSSAWSRFFQKPGFGKSETDCLWQTLSRNEWFHEYCTSGRWMPHTAYLIPRALIERAGKWDETLMINQDGEYICRLISQCNRVVFVPAAVCYYRRHVKNSISSNRSPRALRSLVRSVNLCVDYYLACDASLKARTAAATFLQHTVNTFKLRDPEITQPLQQKVALLGGRLHPPKERPLVGLLRKFIGERPCQWLRVRVIRLRTFIHTKRESTLFSLASPERRFEPGSAGKTARCLG